MADALSECVFCRIVAGKAEASIVLDDERTLAFMDVRQLQGGHTLVVPKSHVADAFALDDALGAALMSSILRVARAVRSAFAPDGVNITQSNGAAAGQEVFHVHFHVIPRRAGDSLLRFYGPPPGRPPRSDLDRQAAALRAVLTAD